MKELHDSRIQEVLSDIQTQNNKVRDIINKCLANWIIWEEKNDRMYASRRKSITKRVSSCIETGKKHRSKYTPQTQNIKQPEPLTDMNIIVSHNSLSYAQGTDNENGYSLSQDGQNNNSDGNQLNLRPTQNSRKARVTQSRRFASANTLDLIDTTAKRKRKRFMYAGTL